jgi:hypothetical protein
MLGPPGGTPQIGLNRKLSVRHAISFQKILTHTVKETLLK